MKNWFINGKEKSFEYDMSDVTDFINMLKPATNSKSNISFGSNNTFYGTININYIESKKDL